VRDGNRDDPGVRARRRGIGFRYGIEYPKRNAVQHAQHKRVWHTVVNAFSVGYGQQYAIRYSEPECHGQQHAVVNAFAIVHCERHGIDVCVRDGKHVTVGNRKRHGKHVAVGNGVHHAQYKRVQYAVCNAFFGSVTGTP
jgi:hypothetical protein